MKKISKVYHSIIAISIVLSICLITHADTDISAHWAEEGIKLLIKNDVVRGDGNGNIRPDDTIKRSEFVSVINKTFSYTKTASLNFKDVSEDKWYAKEFLIAKQQGYLVGDENENVNPDQLITRAEACVILARVLNLSDLDGYITFTDAGSIPSWARGSVHSLSKIGYLNGYSDGSFRAGNPMTRAEVFVILSRIITDEKNAGAADDQRNKGNTSGMAVISPSAKSSRGGGSGGGSASNQEFLDPPIIKRIDDDFVLSWEHVKNAKSYDIHVGVGEESVVLNTAENYIDLRDTVNQLKDTQFEQYATFQIRIKSKASSGYQDSDYSTPVQLKVTVYDPDASANLGLHIDFELDEDGNERYFATWEGEAKRITIRKKTQSQQYSNPQSPLELTEFLTGRNGIESETYIISMDNGTDTQIIVSDFAYAGGSGKQEDPYLIANVRHFNNIYKNISSHFKQIEDITDGTNLVPVYNQNNQPFQGSYIADEPKQVDINIENGGKYSSLFGHCINAKIRNIKLTGRVFGNDIYTAGLVGYAQSTEISDCENEATISVSGESLAGGAYSGGIAGYADENSKLYNCINKGNVISKASMIGGIAGESSAPIQYCHNYGKISTDNSNINSNISYAYVGGIVGNAKKTAKSNANIIDCTNSGMVENLYLENLNNYSIILLTGGIAGFASEISSCINQLSAEVKSKINSGIPKNVLVGQVGGIVGRIESGNITKCKNYGFINSENSNAKRDWFWAGGIVGIANSSSISDCANLSGSITAYQFGGIGGRLLSNTTVNKCYNTGTINTAGFGGGLIGRADVGAVIENCFNIGNIVGTNNGGLVGSIGGAISIKNSYSAPKSNSKNAIAVFNHSLVEAEHIYFVKSGNEVNVNDLAEEVTIEELKDLPKGLDNKEIWTVLLENEENSFTLPQLISNPYYNKYE